MFTKKPAKFSNTDIKAPIYCGWGSFLLRNSILDTEINQVL